MPTLALALVAGGLSTVNPCGFALLPAFLSFYVGAAEEGLPEAPTRVDQGLLVGLAVSLGFLTTFAAIGLPIIYGANRLTQAFPWAGMAVGITLLLTGVAVLFGLHISVTVKSPVKVRRNRQIRTMYLFGVGYGAASLGCALPVLLAVVGASLAGRGLGASLGVFAAYALGMALVLMALSVAAALVREGLARKLKKLLPYLNRVTGMLLLLTGVYVTYYWVRVRFGNIATLGHDPLVGMVEKFTTFVQRASASGGQWIMLAAGAIVLLAIVAGIWRRGQGEPEPDLAESTSSPTPAKVVKES